MHWKDDLYTMISSGATSELAGRVCARSTVSNDFTPVRADGSRVYDSFGRGYMDFCSAVGCANLGYNNPRIMQAMKDQLETGIVNFSHNDWHNPWATLLSAKLSRIVPGEGERVVFLSNSGTEAVECALKMLYKFHQTHDTRRNVYVSFVGAFHGRTLGSLMLNASKVVHRSGFPRASPAEHPPFPEIGTQVDLIRVARERLALDRVAGVFVELVQGEGGINVADAEQIIAFRNFLRENGIPFVVDEVQTGMYRTGKLLACDHYVGIDPDIVTLGKSLGGGLPIGATVAKREFDFPENGAHSNTFGGNALVSVAALETLQIFSDMEEAGYFTSPAFELTQKKLEEISDSGLGFMRRIVCESAEARSAILGRALKNGLILLGSGAKNIRLMPPVNISHGDMKWGAALLKASL